MFDKYNFENIPINRDLYLVDEKYINEYEQSMLDLFKGEEYKYVGYVTSAYLNEINEDHIEFSWAANISDRFHAVSAALPRDQFVACVGSWQYDEKPHIFVKSSWLENLYLRSYSIFAMIDAIDVRKALNTGSLSRELLINLREKIDLLSEKYPDISFISFADSLLLKSNWNAEYFKNNVKYSYEPEAFIYLAQEINSIYKSTLNLETYAIITQGNNEYYDDQVLHISKSKNHVSLNSLGLPFAQLLDIEASVRKGIRSKTQEKSELYMDDDFYYSLNFKHGFEKKNEPSFKYKAKMVQSTCKYYYSSVNNIISNLALK